MSLSEKKSRSIIQRQNIASILTEKLRERILDGEFAGGVLLRQETVAEEFGVSRMPVREALRNLETEGLVIVQAGKGALVSELSTAEVDEIFRLRVLLEVEILRQAIPRMTEASLRHSEALSSELDLAYDSKDIGKWGELNARFHLSLYEPAGMPVTLSIIQRLNYQADRYVRLQLVLDQDMRAGADEHKELCRLCRDGRADAAADLLTRHIQHTRDKLVRTLEAKKSGRDPA